MADKTYLVTGANRGIGLELCRQLVESSAKVIATARDPESAEQLRALEPHRLETLDVADSTSVAALAERLDGSAIDVLINNAGIGGVRSGIARLDMDELQRFFDVNSIGPLRVTQALLPHLKRGQSKVVAHISSNMGSIGNNTAGGYYGYRASKTALNSLNRTLAHELGRKGFICVVLHPGWVRTDMGGEQAPVSAQDSARGLLQVVEGLESEHNGAFFDYTGDPLPW